MEKRLLITGSIFGLLAIILGAFASHGLENSLDIEQIASFQTGVRYQMYQALLLLVVGSMKMLSRKAKNIIFITSLIGVVFFSGSIYALATDTLTSFNFKSIALITPVGGLLLIISWTLLLINCIKIKGE